jgi:hypothetical protein
MATRAHTEAEATAEPEASDSIKELTCFVVAPIGADGSETRKRSDQVLRHVIDPVITELGFAKAVRADKISDGGLITRQVIDNIWSADLVVADLTGSNPNVFYELALRHAFGKPFVQVAVGTVPEQLPFDVADQRTIFFDHKDLDAVEEAKNVLHRFISATMAADAVVESPVSYTMDLMSLRDSSNPEDRSQASIIEMLEDLRSIMVRSSRGGPYPSSPPNDNAALRQWVEDLMRRGRLPNEVFAELITDSTSSEHDDWVESLMHLRPKTGRAKSADDLSTVAGANARASALSALRDGRARALDYDLNKPDPV